MPLIPFQRLEAWLRILLPNSHPTYAIIVAIAVFIVSTTIMYSFFTRQEVAVTASQLIAHRPGQLREYPVEAQSLQWAVVCPECAALNEPEYRYCRRCVGELSGDCDTQ